jgi:hypothetical protein
MQLAGRLFASACAWVSLALGFTLVTAPSADAQGAAARLHIRAVSGQRAFRGHVETPHHVCRPARRVRLYREVDGPDYVVGRAETRADGTWRANVERGEYRPGSYYYARVAPKRIAGRRCVGAKSAYAEAL